MAIVALACSASVMALASQAVALEQQQIPTMSPAPDIYATYNDGTRVIAVFRPTELGLVQISKAEYEFLLLQQRTIQKQEHHAPDMSEMQPKVEKAVTSVQSGVPISWYDEFGNIPEFVRSSLRRRISPYVENRTSQPATRQISASTQQSTTYNFSLSSGEKSHVTAEIGMEVERTHSYSETITTTIPPMYRSWMEFTPIMHNTYGVMNYGVTTDIYPYYVITSRKYPDIYIPRLLHGLLDGIYILMEAPVN